MAIHLPLYEASQLEARTMMRPSYNVLSPSNGYVILKPTQDMVIGSYYLTLMFSKNNFQVKKWFPNEQAVLAAFYQKKITIHTPILVRYPMSCFEVKIENQKLKFLDTRSNLTTSEKELYVYKIFPIGNKEEKFYLITNIGIFIAFSINKNIYKLTDLFLESTPGRLIFSLNFQNSLEI